MREGGERGWALVLSLYFFIYTVARVGVKGGGLMVRMGYGVY